MTQAVLVINIKGGTGKSTVSEVLAKKLRDRGNDVALMDGDIDSANLATRMGADEQVEFEGDHVVKPVEKDGIKLYSMENAFENSSFHQSGEFMGNVVREMINSTKFGDPDYLVVDCPPGSSDVFTELVRALRPNLVGAVSVGISDAVDDTARLIKVCNHNWVPIIGFIENMSGAYCNGEYIQCPGDSSGNFGQVTEEKEAKMFEPHGSGKVKQLAEEMDGEYLGDIPLCSSKKEITEAAEGTITNTATAVERAEIPEMPEDNIGQKGFIRNVVKAVIKGVKEINESIPIDRLQDEFGVEGRDPLIIELEITDAGPISGMFSSLVMTVDDGDLKVMRKSKAKRRGFKPEGGVEITSQDLYDAIRGEKKVMRSVNGEVTTVPYSIIDAFQMGDADIWGDKTINRLAVLDRILNEHIDMSEVQEIMEGV